jgi:hypothetical protein
MYCPPVVSAGLKWQRMRVWSTACPRYVITLQSNGCARCLGFGYCPCLEYDGEYNELRGNKREKVKADNTGSRNYGCHTECWRLLRTLRSCAFYVGPTGEEPGPSHWKLRSDRRLWLTRLLCLLCGRSIHPMAFEKSPTSDDPCGSLCGSRHQRSKR